MADSDVRAAFKLRFHRPPANVVDDARRYAESFCLRAGADPVRATDVAMATYELLQNAVRYGGDEVELALSIARGRVKLTVSNPTSAEHAARLRELAAQMRAQPDRLKHFAAVLEQRPASGSGLGLARVSYEGQLEVEIAVRSRRVTVRAAGRLNNGDGS